MNMQLRNQLIAGFNRIAEGSAMVSKALEDDGWEGIEDHAEATGLRPLAAACLEEPSFQAALEEMAEAEAAAMNAAAPSPTPEPPPAPAVTLEQVRGVLVELSQAGLRDQVHQLIRDLGAEALSQVDPAQYTELLERAEELRNA
ncbi:MULTISPECIES: hypothetical protein [Actinomycetaceae]|uniref:Uncharacterized protein n=2 Tax=Trueperella TaxID=1069494 RepID=A0ABT9PK85_9ACTO|nr:MULTISPECIES: hypothetical protein [Actinomycetaceae]MCI7456899.1 hypothetical protein [Actinomyces urogenitalis]MDP9832799.1 hypothetical protein [Trueperella abortisuis]